MIAIGGGVFTCKFCAEIVIYESKAKRPLAENWILSHIEREHPKELEFVELNNHLGH